MGHRRWLPTLIALRSYQTSHGPPFWIGITRTGQQSLSNLQSLQDWTVRYGLQSVPGVAEVASIGGFVKQYNVILDPQRMRDRGISMQKIREAVRASNADVGGRTVELSEFEYVIRGKGYIRGINDLGNIVLKSIESLALAMFSMLKRELTASAPRQLGAMLARNAFRAIRRRMDPEVYGGAPLLGFNGAVLKAHASAHERAITSAVRATCENLQHHVNNLITDEIARANERLAVSSTPRVALST